MFLKGVSEGFHIEHNFYGIKERIPQILNFMWFNLYCCQRGTVFPFLNPPFLNIYKLMYIQVEVIHMFYIDKRFTAVIWLTNTGPQGHWQIIELSCGCDQFIWPSEA
jgi:hypothetical protein